jgi:hypothetical protein
VSLSHLSNWASRECEPFRRSNREGSSSSPRSSRHEGSDWKVALPAGTTGASRASRMAFQYVSGCLLTGDIKRVDWVVVCKNLLAETDVATPINAARAASQHQMSACFQVSPTRPCGGSAWQPASIVPGQRQPTKLGVPILEEHGPSSPGHCEYLTSVH